jgi:hypothetical protein
MGSGRRLRVVFILVAAMLVVVKIGVLRGVVGSARERHDRRDGDC